VYPFVELFLKLRMMSAYQGSLSGSYLATSDDPDVFKNKGKYYFKCKQWEENSFVEDEKLRKELWNKTESIYSKYFK
jgi:hypothetical protein